MSEHQQNSFYSQHPHMSNSMVFAYICLVFKLHTDQNDVHTSSTVAFKFNRLHKNRVLVFVMRALLRRSQMTTALFCVIRQRVAVISDRLFGTTYRSHTQGWLNLRMGPIVCPETSVRNYHYTLRNNTEQRSSQLLRDWSLKSQSYQLLTLSKLPW
jgi:hypothetical protein